MHHFDRAIILIYILFTKICCRKHKLKMAWATQRVTVEARNSCISLAVCANGSLTVDLMQEKKGQEQMKPEEKEAQRREYEFQKLEKLLSMVRQPDNAQKDDKSQPK